MNVKSMGAAAGAIGAAVAASFLTLRHGPVIGIVAGCVIGALVGLLVVAVMRGRNSSTG